MAMEVDEAEAEDDKLYCFCRQPSHGEVRLLTRIISEYMLIFAR